MQKSTLKLLFVGVTTFTKFIGTFIGPVNSATVLILSKHHFIRIVNEMLVGKHLEERKCFLLVRFDPIGRWLIRPTHDAVFGVALAEYLQILGLQESSSFFISCKFFSGVMIFPLARCIIPVPNADRRNHPSFQNLPSLWRQCR